MFKTVSAFALLGLLTVAAPSYAANEKAAEKQQQAAAATAPAGKIDLANAAAGDYAIDPNHTNVFFRVAHLGFSGYMGRFNKIEGKVTLDPKDLSKTVLDVTIDAASVDTNNEKLENELREKEVFDTANYPVISFKGTKFEQKDANHGAITGDLTFHGVTKPVTLDVRLNGVGPHPMSQKPTLGFSATGTIKRSDFGVSKWLPMVDDSVQLIIETELNHAG